MAVEFGGGDVDRHVPRTLYRAGDRAFPAGHIRFDGAAEIDCSPEVADGRDGDIGRRGRAWRDPHS